MMNAARVLSHGKIESLTAAFSLRNAQPFALFIIPADTEETAPVLVNCKLYQDDLASDCPFNLNCWTEPAIMEISASAIDLEDYDLYWGSGANVEES